MSQTWIADFDSTPWGAGPSAWHRGGAHQHLAVSLRLRLEAATAQRADEPAWHRRQRRRRAQARVLVRVAAAKALLSGHHSAQHRGGDGASMYKRVAFIPDVPRGVHPSRGIRPWSCHCGEADNWLCRPRCKGCGREQPRSIAAEAKRVAEQCRREREERRRSPSRGRSRERRRRGSEQERSQSRGRNDGGGGKKKGNGGGGSGGGGGSSGNGGGDGGGGGGGGQGGQSKSYAEAARRADELRRQLAAERREREALVKKLAAATASKDAKDCDADHGPLDDGDDEVDDDASKELRMQQLLTVIEGLEPVVSEDDPKLVALRGERESLARARQEGKPLKTQLIAIDRKLERKRAAIKKLEARQSAAWAAYEEARRTAEALDKESDDLNAELDALEKDKKLLLRRELEGDGGAGTREEDAHWEGTVDAIRTRLQVPGVHPELASAVAATLELLRQQCLQLPAVVPPAAAEAGGGGARPSEGGRGAGGHSDGTPRRPTAASSTSGGIGSGGGDGKGGSKVAEQDGGAHSSAAAAGKASGGKENEGGLLAKPALLAPHAGMPAPPLPASPSANIDKSKGADAAAAAEVAVPSDPPTGLAEQDVEMGEVENLLRKMPSRRRNRFLAAVKADKFDSDDEDGEDPQRDRERSPRPTGRGGEGEL